MGMQAIDSGLEVSDSIFKVTDPVAIVQVVDVANPSLWALRPSQP